MVLESRRVLFLNSNQEFYLQRFRLQIVLNMNAHSNPRKLSNQCRSKNISDGAEMKETELDVLKRQWNKGARDWESGGRGLCQVRCSQQRSTFVRTRMAAENPEGITAETYPWTWKNGSSETTKDRERLQRMSSNQHERLAVKTPKEIKLLHMRDRLHVLCRSLQHIRAPSF